MPLPIVVLVPVSEASSVSKAKSARPPSHEAPASQRPEPVRPEIWIEVPRPSCSVRLWLLTASNSS